MRLDRKAREPKICSCIIYSTLTKGEITQMNDKEYKPFYDKRYLEMWGVNAEEEIHFYYDESNNCRKFWLDSEKKEFNHDFRADFVLAGIAIEKEFQIPFEELKQRFKLQNNVVELKSKSLFRGKDFLQCMRMKQVTALIKLFSDYDLYIHYSHVNNFFYTIVEILDSITTPDEINEFGFNYFRLKTTFYNMLFPNIDKVIQTMIKYSYPNIKTEQIKDFCNELLSDIDLRYEQKPDEKFISGMLRRASQSTEMLFIQNNIDFVMQEDYSIFYVDPILKFRKAVHHFDEEASIQDKVSETISKLEKNVTNYEFINSRDNTMIQISDLVAGLLGKMFIFINSIPSNNMRKTVEKLNNIQIINCLAFNGLRIKSDSRNKGFLHSMTAIGVIDKLNKFFEIVESECKHRADQGK